MLLTSSPVRASLPRFPSFCKHETIRNAVEDSITWPVQKVVPILPGDYRSVIEVHNGLTYLDLIVIQIENLNKKYGCRVPLLLMNSFNTHDDTQKVNEFTPIEKFKIFNKNNLWVNLKAIKMLVEADALKMENILNPKDVDGVEFLQLETAAGAAVTK